MEPHGFADLFQHELAFGFQIVTGQAFCAASNQDGLKMEHANALGEFVENQVKTMIEAPDDRSVSFISVPWRVEMEDLANKAPRVGTLYMLIRSGVL